MTPYETLGLHEDADAEAIRAAYRKAAKKAHPDRKGGSTQAMTAINTAYALLSDPERRERFDRTGSADQKKTPEQQGLSVLYDIIRQLVCGNSTNLVVEARQVLSRGIATANQAIAQHETDKAKIARKRKTLKAKKGDSVFDGLFAELIQSQERGIESAKTQRDSFAAALVLLEDYESDDDAQMQTMFASPGFNQFFTGTAR